MSGGHFDYNQYKIQYMIDEIEHLILNNENEELNQWGDKIGSFYSKETITEFKAAIALLKVTYVFAQRIDWLVSGDDSEENFHRRLKEDLEKLQNV